MINPQVIALDARRSLFTLWVWGQYSHNIADAYWGVAYGYSWRKRLNVKPCIKEAVALWLADAHEIGQLVKYSALPDSVKKYIKQLSNG